MTDPYGAHEQVVDDPVRRRFVLEVDGQTSELVYARDAKRIELVHTGVPESQRRRGYAERLVRAALAGAAREGLTVVPRCPYVRHWLVRHPEEATAVSLDWGPGGPDAPPEPGEPDDEQSGR